GLLPSSGRLQDCPRPQASSRPHYRSRKCQRELLRLLSPRRIYHRRLVHPFCCELSRSLRVSTRSSFSACCIRSMLLDIYVLLDRSKSGGAWTELGPHRPA